MPKSRAADRQGRDVPPALRECVPAVCTSSPEIARSSVVLPQPDGPRKRDELAALDVEVDILERGERAEALGETADRADRRSPPWRRSLVRGMAHPPRAERSAPCRRRGRTRARSGGQAAQLFGSDLRRSASSTRRGCASRLSAAQAKSFLISSCSMSAGMNSSLAWRCPAARRSHRLGVELVGLLADAAQSASFLAASRFLRAVMMARRLHVPAEPFGRQHDVDRRAVLLGLVGAVLEGEADRVFAGRRLLAGLRAGMRVGGDVLVQRVHVGPALLLAHHLQPGRDHQIAGAGGGRVRHGDLALVFRLDQVVPGGRLRQALASRLRPC